MSDFWERLKQRKLVQWALAYLAGAWALLQVLEMASGSYGWPALVMRLAFGVAVLGFIVVLVLAWYHGERGVQKVSGTELLLLALVLAIGGALVWRSGTQTGKAGNGAPAAPAVSPVPAASAASAKSIAVLPFENLSADKDNEYFVAGMQDLILTKLADIGELKVISRTSTMKYRSRPENLKQVGAELGVAHVLEGSVQRQGSAVLVNVQLIDTATDAHLWAESYQRTLDNVFGVEGEVAEKIALALKAELSPAESARLGTDMSGNAAANNLFLQAEYQTNRGDTDYNTANWKAAIALYRQAVAQAPDFALAYARMSYVESDLAWFGGGGMDVKTLAADAREHANVALEIAPDLPAAHLAIGYCNYFGRGDFDAALGDFATSLEQRPNNTDALAARGYVERRQGRYDAAVASLQQAINLDPRNSQMAYELASTMMMAGRYPDAEREAQRAMSLDPQNLNAKNALSTIYLFESGDIPRALGMVQGDAPRMKLQRVRLLTLQRRYADALALLDGVPDTPDNFFSTVAPKPLLQAQLYRLLGDRDRALDAYVRAEPVCRAQIGQMQGVNLAAGWQQVAEVQFGLGKRREAMASMAKAEQIIDHADDGASGADLLMINALIFAKFGETDRAMPLLERALATPGIGRYYSPALLWLDPELDPIRDDPRFQSLLRKYADRKPAGLQG
ncbi:MAG TPA: tetratricopeptide repeat protein [Rhodanobacteraceae bacterium]|nr:tetratricopeptide repeat protein [Rhodanobacteraceae bacterium]